MSQEEIYSILECFSPNMSPERMAEIVNSYQNAQQPSILLAYQSAEQVITSAEFYKTYQYMVKLGEYLLSPTFEATQSFVIIPYAHAEFYAYIDEIVYYITSYLKEWCVHNLNSNGCISCAKQSAGSMYINEKDILDYVHAVSHDVCNVFIGLDACNQINTYFNAQILLQCPNITVIQLNELDQLNNTDNSGYSIMFNAYLKNLHFSGLKPCQRIGDDERLIRVRLDNNVHIEESITEEQFTQVHNGFNVSAGIYELLVDGEGAIDDFLLSEFLNQITGSRLGLVAPDGRSVTSMFLVYKIQQADTLFSIYLIPQREGYLVELAQEHIGLCGQVHFVIFQKQDR